jgi:hypothetical protein
MEKITQDENTKLIESYLGITIDELVEFLVDGEFTYDRSEVKPIREKLEANGKLDEVSKWRFMWIDKQVYEVMSKNYDEWKKGHHDYGTPEMLSLLGFTEIEGAEIDNYDPKRFNKKYQRGDLRVYSDGTTMLSETGNRFIYYTNKGGESSLETYMELPDELKYLGDKISREVWRLMSPKKCREKLLYVFGDNYHGYDLEDRLEETVEAIRKSLIEQGKEVPENLIKKEPKKIHRQYLDNLEVFGDLLVGITNVRSNMHSMSSRWFPHALHLTPQCGDHRIHQILLEEFTKINKSYVYEEE